MAASYPGATKSFTTKLPGQTIASADMNAVQDETVAIETGLLTGLSHDLLFTDATYDIGRVASLRPRNLVLSGDATVGGALAVSGAATITGALTVTGAITGGGGLPVLLHANSGTDTTAAATTVDSIAITGLTAKDTLIIETTLDAVTQNVAAPILYSVTDALQLAWLTNAAAALPLGLSSFQTTRLRQRQEGATKVASFTVGLDGSTSLVGGGATWGRPTLTTPWTGSWTLGLRHGGVTAGGTFGWSWTVIKVPGQ